MLWLTKNIDIATLNNAIKTFGERSQEDVAIEEMSELTKAIIKNRRYKTDETRENIREEIADVLIMLVQLIVIHGFDEAIIKKKIDRLKQRITAEKCDINKHIVKRKFKTICKMELHDLSGKNVFSELNKYYANKIKIDGKEYYIGNLDRESISFVEIHPSEHEIEIGSLIFGHPTEKDGESL